MNERNRVSETARAEWDGGVEAAETAVETATDVDVCAANCARSLLEAADWWHQMAGEGFRTLSSDGSGAPDWSVASAMYGALNRVVTGQGDFERTHRKMALEAYLDGAGLMYSWTALKNRHQTGAIGKPVTSDSLAVFDSVMDDKAETAALWDHVAEQWSAQFPEDRPDIKIWDPSGKTADGAGEMQRKSVEAKARQAVGRKPEPESEDAAPDLGAVLLAALQAALTK